MMEDDMKRNGSGYIDETPVKSGVLTGPQPGEIWEDTNGKLFLILKNQSGYSNVLAMQGNTAHDDNIAINTEMGIFFVNPGMVRFLLGRDKGRYIYTIPLDKHMEIMEAVSDRLGVTIRVSGSNGHNLEELTTAGNEDLLGECARLECRLEESEKQREVLANHLEATKEELYQVKEAHEKLLGDYSIVRQSRDEMMEDFKNAHTALQAEKHRADDAHKAYIAELEKRKMCEAMYRELLNRLFARGEAK